MGEWQAFERVYGPILIHDRLDWGLAVLRTQNEGGGAIKMPPWHKDTSSTDEDAIWATFQSFGRKRE